jgi:hypothetical protein
LSEPRFTSGGSTGGEEGRKSKQDLLSPVSEEYVEKLDRLIPALDPAPESVESGPGYAERKRQINLILASRSFRNAPLLQKFLEFITVESSQGRHDELSEYVIATQVFGRSSDFDPAADTIVRTQAYRLRTKLNEYYENEGKTDRVIVGAPKGRYIPAFSYREDPEVESSDKESAEEPVRAVSKTSLWTRPQSPLVLLAAVLVIALAFVAGALLGRRWTPALSSTPAIAQSVPQPLQAFWSQFIGGGDVIVAYTNEVFLETETADLLRLRKGGAFAARGAVVRKEAAQNEAMNPELAAHAGPLYYEEGFTGTGEVLATYRLASLLTKLGANVEVKRSRLVTIDDLRNRDVIFLGSPFDNEVLAEMHIQQRFSFVQPEKPPYLWRGSIADHQAAGRGVAYGIERDPQSQVIRVDYALFDVLPSPAPGRRIVVLAGLTTSGTQGAAEFATSVTGLQQILALGKDSPQDRSKSKTFPRCFESLLRVEAEKGLEAINVSLVEGSAVELQK